METQSSSFIAKRTLPNATAVLVLGILTIVLFMCCFVPSLTTGIIALVMGFQGKKMYRNNPEEFTESSFKNLNAGFICAIIGLVMTVAYFIYSLYTVFTNPEIMEKFREAMEQAQ
jgi:membrane-bound ClpP family serine protease